MRCSRPHPDAIADCVLNAFSALPQKYKPRRLADGRREWVPLAGIVLSRRPSALPKNGQQHEQGKTEEELRCVSLATGMKCLPHAKVKTAQGNVLHDSHAEILALRGFNRWLVDECAELARSGFGSGLEGEKRWVRWKENADTAKQDTRGNKPPFELHEDVRLHMYCSEAPCGDASMELVMREQEDDTPWDPVPPPPTALASEPPRIDIQDAADADQEQPSMLGRGYFSHLGIVRRKPARPDAPVTLSKSCSDKLAMKQCTGLLSGVTARLVGKRGTWLDTLVLPKERLVEGAVERAFGPTGRMKPLFDERVVGRWEAMGFGYKPCEVLGTGREFEYSKETASAASQGSAAVPSNLATVCTPHKSEILINGVLQGRRQDDPKGASCVSRRRMWEAATELETGFQPERAVALRGQTYAEFKAGSEVGRQREIVKADVRALALKGWRRNVGDEEWRREGAGEG